MASIPDKEEYRLVVACAIMAEHVGMMTAQSLKDRLQELAVEYFAQNPEYKGSNLPELSMSMTAYGTCAIHVLGSMVASLYAAQEHLVSNGDLDAKEGERWRNRLVKELLDGTVAKAKQMGEDVAKDVKRMDEADRAAKEADTLLQSIVAGMSKH